MKNSVYAALLALSPLAAHAGTIDTSGSVGDDITFSVGNGADVAGGSFTADANTLVSFTLDVFSENAGAYRAVVFDFGGTSAPANLIWQSGDIIGTTSLSTYSLTPGISLVTETSTLSGSTTGARHQWSAAAFMVSARQIPT